MNQIRLSYLYTWKCHKETPCVAISKSKNVIFSSFFLYKIRKQESRTGPDWGAGSGGRGEQVGKLLKNGVYGANTVYTCI
jgi:hypothetical protein